MNALMVVHAADDSGHHEQGGELHRDRVGGEVPSECQVVEELWG